MHMHAAVGTNRETMHVVPLPICPTLCPGNLHLQILNEKNKWRRGHPQIDASEVSCRYPNTGGRVKVAMVLHLSEVGPIADIKENVKEVIHSTDRLELLISTWVVPITVRHLQSTFFASSKARRICIGILVLRQIYDCAFSRHQHA